MKFEWEIILENANSTISRARIDGCGWLVNSLTESPTKQLSESMVFVPDPEHKWSIE